MNNKKRIVVVMFFLLFSSACTRPLEKNTIPIPDDKQYAAEDLFASTNAQESVSLPEKKEVNQNDADATTGKDEPDQSEYLQPQENIDYVKYDAANYPKMLDVRKNLHSMFCLDPDTGVAYFINQNKDGYIYRLINGKAELVVELPARELHMLNGVLYFIIENSYEYKKLAPGDICAYVPAEESVGLVFSPKELEGEIYRIMPYEDGIAFCNRIAENEIKIDENEIQYYPTRYEYYFYRLADAVLETDSHKRVIPGWREFYLDWDVSGDVRKTALRSRKNYDEMHSNYVGTKSFVIDNMLYVLGSGKCGIHNLLTGEQMIYDVGAMFRELVPKHMELLDDARNFYGIDFDITLDCFTVDREFVWIVMMKQYVCRLDPLNEEMVCYRIDGSNYTISDLYTDGINLYGVYGSLDGEDGSMVHICTEKAVGQDSIFDVPLLVVEYLTE